MAQMMFYRYISHPNEISQIRNERRIQTTNPHNAQGTWFAPIRYDDLNKAQRELSLDTKPSHRVGPIPADEMPDFDIPVQTAPPLHGQPGGGLEACTTGEIWISGLYDFITDGYLPLH